jgi:hypothetical protein
MITGANALAITDWNEQSGYTTLSVHFVDCHSKKVFEEFNAPSALQF